jgi:hypothetical protein
VLTDFGLARAAADARLTKVAAEVIVRTRRIVARLSSSWPHLDWYRRVCERLNAPLAFPVLHPSG